MADGMISYSPNQNESLNGIVWSKTPKHKYNGPKAIKMVALSAVRQFDSGSKARHEVMKVANIPSGRFTEESGAQYGQQENSLFKKESKLGRKKEKNSTKTSKAC
jgi:hypothetical protein